MLEGCLSHSEPLELSSRLMPLKILEKGLCYSGRNYEIVDYIGDFM